MVTALAGVILYRFIRRVRWYRATLNALAASLVCLLLGWITAGPLLAAAAVLLLFGLPAAFWQLRQHCAVKPAIRVLLAWLAAALPAVLIQTPLF